MAGKGRRRASNSNRIGMAAIAVIVAVLLAVLLYQSYGLKQKNQAFQEQIAQLEEDIAREQDRTEEIAGLIDYIQTDEYIEKLAREKFGLVYEDEIVFKEAK